LNSDTRVLPDSVDRALAFMDENPRVGIVGVRLLNGDGTFQASFTPFPNLWQEFLILSRLGRWLVRPSYPSLGPQVEQGPQRVRGYMEGACLVARGEAVSQVGGLDESIFMYAEEVDWCFRFHQADWELWYLPQAPIVHYGGQSSRKRQGRMEAELYRSRVLFFHKHRSQVEAWCLVGMVYGATAIKMALHGMLRLLTGGRKGRTVTTWRQLRAAMSRAEAVPERG
jgi:N-acetylglucosaminyl-diphospho-decaprenol L-rhamnosyltransferase